MKSIDDSLVRVLKSAGTLPDTAPASRSPGSDAGTLAREICLQFAEDLKKYARFLEPDRKILDGTQVTQEDLDKSALAKPPDKITFDGLQALAHQQPEVALARWEEVKAATREDLANGWLAGRSVAKDAWERAGFLAVRDELRAAWPLGNGVEAMLVDEMAQYETLRRKLLADVAERRWTGDPTNGKEYVVPAAMLQAVDRLQRLFQYALRALLGMRRARSPVTVTGSSRPRLGDGRQASPAPDISSEESTS